MSEIIKEMYTIAEEIKSLTLQLTFSGNKEYYEKEIDNYHQLMEKREPLVNRMTALKAKADVDGVLYRKEEGLSQLVDDITKMDASHKKEMLNIRDSLRSSIKDVKNTKRINNAYAHPVDIDAPSMMDTKK